MKRNYLSFLLRNFNINFSFLKKIRKSVFHLSVFFFFVLHSVETSAQVNWGNATPPSSTEILKDLGGTGKIYKTTWSGSNTLENSEQILHMAELDFFNTSSPLDYELKIAYVYNDPDQLPEKVPVDPAVCKEICYYIACTEGPECNNGLQRFCEPVPGGQFDFVSHIAAKYGAVMATNGAFYDYFYNCVPGVKSYIKIDDHVFSKPNILNHRNEGALAFDFSGATPKIDIFERSATTLQDLDNGNIYHSRTSGNNISSFSNVMSGGHLNEKLTETDPISPYSVKTPDFCDGITYPWSGVAQYTGDNDILKKNGKPWRDFACPTIPNTGEVDKPLAPTAYGYQDFFKCSNLDNSNLQKRKQLTCVDYAKFGEEFGGQDGLAKRSRTFIAMKGQKLYWFVADGAIKCKKPNGQIVPGNQCATGDRRLKGFTIGELDQFARDMGFDKMLNFDGGSSSAFYLNGKGILQFQYDPNAPASNKRVGPQAQRLLQSVLMLVPKQKNIEEVYDLHSDHARINNGDSYIDLTPGLDKINNHRLAGIFGRYKTRKMIDYDHPNAPGVHDYGRLLVSIAKDENKALNEAVFAGVGSIPNKLLQILKNEVPLHDNINSISQSDYVAKITENKFYYWAFKIEQSKVVAFDIYPKDNGLDLFSKTPTPFDGKWHDFMLIGNGYSYDCFTCGNDNNYETDFGLWFDDWPGLLNYSIKGHAKVRETSLGNLYVNGATNLSVGGMLYNGEYILSTHNNEHIDFQDFVFTKNFDNYYEYGSDEITTGRQYGDPSKEYKYLRSKNWNSDLYDELHHNETSGDDGNTVFCFDETAGSKLAYAWYRGQHTKKRSLKTFGTYVGETYTKKGNRNPRSTIDGVVKDEDVPRALYHITNKQNGLKLEAKHDPYNNQGTVYLENNVVVGGAGSPSYTVFGTTNKFLLETIGENRMLISNAGLFTLKGSGTSVQTNLDFSPNDLENYWELEPALEYNEFYIKHKHSGKYLTGGNAGSNISLSDFNDSKSQQWSFEKTDDAEKVIIEDYYQLTRLSKAIPSSLTVENVSDSDNQKWLIDYVGGGFYMLKPKTLDKVFTANLKTNQRYYVSAPNYTTSLENFGISSKTQLFAIELTENDSKVNIHRYVMYEGTFKRAEAWDNYEHGFYNISLGYYENLRRDYTIIYKEKSPNKLLPSHYEIGSLAHTDLVASHSGNQVLAQTDDDSSSNHIWDFHDIGLGRYLILQSDASSYSDVNSNKWTPTTAYTNRKAFEVVVNDDGSSTLKHNGQCLTDNGNGQEYSFTNCNLGDNQKYILYLSKHHEFKTIDRGYYRIVNKNSKKALKEVGNYRITDTSAPVANVVQYEYSDDINHNDQWLLEPKGNDEYLIRNRESTGLMDVHNASTANDANIENYVLTRLPQQRWKLVPSSQEGFYQIKNVKSEKCLDVHLAALGNGVNIKQLSCRQSDDIFLPAQLFAIEKVAEVVPVFPDITYQLESNHFLYTGEGKSLGQFPVSFDDNVQFSYGTYSGINKSDLFHTEYQGAGLYRISRNSNDKVMAIGDTDPNYHYKVVQKNKASGEFPNHAQLWSFETGFGGYENKSSEFDIVSADYTKNALYLGAGGETGELGELFAIDDFHFISDWKLVPIKEPKFTGVYKTSYTPSLTDMNGIEINGGRNDAFLYSNSVPYHLEIMADGYYRLRASRSDVLDKVLGTDGTTVLKQDWNGNNSQKWSIEAIENDNRYRFVNKHYSKAAQISSFSVAPIILGDWNSGNNYAKWFLYKQNSTTLQAKVVSLEEEESSKQEQFIVSPNPSQGEIIIDLSLFKNKNFKTLRFNFHDLSGRLLYGTDRKVNLERNPIIQFTELTQKGFIILNILGPNNEVLGSKNVIFR